VQAAMPPKDKRIEQLDKILNFVTFPNDKDEKTTDENNENVTNVTNPTLAKISVIVLLIVISGFIIVETLRFLGTITDKGFSISIITIMGATILYAISKDRTELINYIVRNKQGSN
jgi:hypothetical protein